MTSRLRDWDHLHDLISFDVSIESWRPCRERVGTETFMVKYYNVSTHCQFSNDKILLTVCSEEHLSSPPQDFFQAEDRQGRAQHIHRERLPPLHLCNALYRHV